MNFLERVSCLFEIDIKEAEEALNQLGKQFINFSETVKDGAIKAAQAAKEGAIKATRAANGIAQKTTQAAYKNFQSLKTRAQETAGVLGRSFMRTLNAIKEAVSQGKNSFIQAFKTATNQANPHVQKFIEKAKKGFSNLAQSIKGQMQSAFSIQNMFNNALARIDSLADFGKVAQKARIGVESLDILSKSARSLSGDVGAAQNDIQSFADSVSSALADKGSQAAAIFKDLGKSLTDSNGDIEDTAVLIEKLADKMGTLNKVEQETTLKNLGIRDPGMRSYIQSDAETRKGLGETHKKNGAVTTQQVDVAIKAQKAMNELNDAFQGVSNELTTAVAPALSFVSNKLKEFIVFAKENKPVMVGVFAALALGAGTYAMAMASAALATIVAAAPFLAIVAVVTALGLAIYDVTKFLRGQPSVLGDLAKKYPALGKAIEIIGDAWEAVKTRIQPVIDLIKSIGKMIISIFSGDMEGAKEAAFEALNAIKQYFQNAWDDIKNVVSTIVNWVKKKLWELLPNWAKRWLGGEGEEKRAEVEAQSSGDDDLRPPDESVATAQIHLETTNTHAVPENAAEIAKAQKYEDNKQTNVTVGPTTVTVHTNETAKELENIAKKTTNKAFKQSSSISSSGFDDSRQN
ncbi:hypothetical protein [Bartonella tamiae]|nr:hypothetical protein [Bartonella tamiae]